MYPLWQYRLTHPSSQLQARSWRRTSRRTLPSCRLPRAQPWSAIRIPGQPILMRVFVSQQTPFCVIDGSARISDAERHAPLRPSTCRDPHIATNMPCTGIRAIKRLGKPDGLAVAGDGALGCLPHQGGAKLSPQSRAPCLPALDLRRPTRSSFAATPVAAPMPAKDGSMSPRPLAPE